MQVFLIGTTRATTTTVTTIKENSTVKTLDANKDMKRQMTSLNKTVKSFIAQVSKNKKKKKKKKKSKEKVFPNQPFSFSSSESDEEDDN